MTINWKLEFELADIPPLTNGEESLFPKSLEKFIRRSFIWAIKNKDYIGENKLRVRMVLKDDENKQKW